MTNEKRWSPQNAFNEPWLGQEGQLTVFTAKPHGVCKAGTPAQLCARTAKVKHRDNYPTRKNRVLRAGGAPGMTAAATYNLPPPGRRAAVTGMQDAIIDIADCRRADKPLIPESHYSNTPSHGSLSYLHRHRRPGRNGRQDAVAVPGAGRALPQALAHRLGHPVATLANHALAGAVGSWVTTRAGARRAALGAGRVLHRHGGVDADSRQAGR
jgi:hypothetical protein